MTTIAFIGLGNMGMPMVTNLIKAGHALKVFDLKAEAVQAVCELGGKSALNQADAARDSDIVITMLPEGSHVEAVYLGDDGVIAHARDNALLIDCSTIDVETARRVAALASSARQLDLLDAPVSGGTIGAQQGSLTFMVGGSDAAVARAHPVLEAMGRSIIHTGGSGSGQAAKICNNLMLGISMLGVCEAFALADRLGLDRQKLFDVSSRSSGQCWSLTTNCPVPGPVPNSPANRDYKPGFTVSMMAKDLRLAETAARNARMPSLMGSEAQNLYTFCEALGHGDLDFSGIFRMISAKI